MSNPGSRISVFYGELRRRKVLNTLVLYALSCWVILQLGSIVFPVFGLEKDYFYWLAGIFTVFLPVVLTISWFYKLTASGFIRIAPFSERRVLNNMPPRVDRRVSLEKKKNDSHTPGRWSIFAETGPMEGLEYTIAGPVILGRAIECEITLLRSYISRNHARLQVVDNALSVEDLGSANGTLVNGVKISGVQQLHHGDELRFKDVVFRVREHASHMRNESLLNQTTVIGKH